MKEATGELNMTVIVIIAAAAILAFVTLILPNIFNSINNSWIDADKNGIDIGYIVNVPKN